MVVEPVLDLGSIVEKDFFTSTINVIRAKTKHQKEPLSERDKVLLDVYIGFNNLARLVVAELGPCVYDLAKVRDVLRRLKQAQDAAVKAAAGKQSISSRRNS